MPLKRGVFSGRFPLFQWTFLVAFSSALTVFTAAVVATAAAATAEPFTRKFLRFDFAMFSSKEMNKCRGGPKCPPFVTFFQNQDSAFFATRPHTRVRPYPLR